MEVWTNRNMYHFYISNWDNDKEQEQQALCLPCDHLQPSSLISKPHPQSTGVLMPWATMISRPLAPLFLNYLFGHLFTYNLVTYKHKFHIISLLNRKTWPNFITRKIRYLIKVQTHSWVRHCDGKQEYWAGLWHPALGRFTFLLDRESWPGSRRPRGGYKEAPRA